MFSFFTDTLRYHQEVNKTAIKSLENNVLLILNKMNDDEEKENSEDIELPIDVDHFEEISLKLEVDKNVEIYMVCTLKYISFYANILTVYNLDKTVKTCWWE